MCLRLHDLDVNWIHCDKMSKQAENCIKEAIKNIKEKKRKKCNLAAIKKYLEDENSLPLDLELQLREMTRSGLVNMEETYSLGTACKGATAAVVLESNDENIVGECNVKHHIPELTNLSERIKILESKLDSTTQPHYSSQPSPRPIDPVNTRLENEIEFLKQEISVKNRQISTLIASSKCNKIHGNSGNGHSFGLIDVDKVGCNVSHGNQSQVEKANPMGRRQSLDNFTVTRRRPVSQFPDIQNKNSQERLRYPGELTYAELTKRKHAIADETKKVEDIPFLLSMTEYPALYNRFSPLSTDKSRTNNDEEVEKEDIDDGESGLSKQAVLLNRQRQSAAENQRQARRYTKPTTVVLGDSIVKNIKGYKMKEAVDHQENVHVYTFPGANIDDMNSHVTPTMRKNPETIILH